jgi:hypothetical protein
MMLELIHQAFTKEFQRNLIKHLTLMIITKGLRMQIYQGFIFRGILVVNCILFLDY